jgi:drug/metabolite transporter (DMT)-like permease
VSTFYLNNAGFMAVLLGLCLACRRRRSPRPLWALFIWASGQQLCNAVFHVYTQVVFNAYSPGLFTAVFGYVPVYTYLTALVLRQRLLPGWFLPIGLLVGALGLWFTIWAGLYHFGPMPSCRWAPFSC